MTASPSIPDVPCRPAKCSIELDTRQERAQLAAAEADRDLAKVNFDRMEGLLNESVISKAEYDKAASERKQTEAKVGEIEAMIARKTIKAPFTGILGIRQVNRGQYLKAGDPIVALQALNPIYVNFDVPQQDAERVRVGRAVQVTAKDIGGTTPFAGQVTAIDSVVDQATRNVKIQATLANPEGKLRPGMFVDVEVVTGAVQTRDRAAGLGHQLRAVRRLRVHRHRHEDARRQGLQGRAAAVRQGRGDARRPGGGAVGRQAER